MDTYQIIMRKKKWGWTSLAVGNNLGDFIKPRWWWRPSYQWASDCAHRWCQSHYNRTSRDVFNVEFTPAEKDRS